MLETSNCVNCSRRNPKRSGKYVYHTGRLASSIARAGTSCVKEEGKSEIHHAHDGPSFSPRVCHQERTTSQTSIRSEAGRQGILYCQQAEEEVQEEVLPVYP